MAWPRGPAQGTPGGGASGHYFLSLWAEQSSLFGQSLFLAMNDLLLGGEEIFSLFGRASLFWAPSSSLFGQGVPLSLGDLSLSFFGQDLFLGVNDPRLGRKESLLSLGEALISGQAASRRPGLRRAFGQRPRAAVRKFGRQT